MEYFDGFGQIKENSDWYMNPFKPNLITKHVIYSEGQDIRLIVYSHVS